MERLKEDTLNGIILKRGLTDIQLKLVLNTNRLLNLMLEATLADKEIDENDFARIIAYIDIAAGCVMLAEKKYGFMDKAREEVLAELLGEGEDGKKEETPTHKPWRKYDHTLMTPGHRYVVRKRNLSSGMVEEMEFFLWEGEFYDKIRNDVDDSLYLEFFETGDYRWEPFDIDKVEVGRRYCFRRPEEKYFMVTMTVGREEVANINPMYLEYLRKEYDEKRLDFTEMADITDDVLWSEWFPFTVSDVVPELNHTKDKEE
jgi:hypothetical protein